MTSIKLKFRPSSIKDKEGSLYFQIIRHRSVCRLTLDYHIYEDEWDNSTNSIIIESATSERREFLSLLVKEIEIAYIDFLQIIETLRQTSDAFSATDICQYYTDVKSKNSLYLFMSGLIANLQRQGRYRTAETYYTALKSFMRFRKNVDISIPNIDSDIVEDYQAYLRQRGLTMNTISFYMRILRAVYNRAIEREIISSKNPFKHVYTGIERTIKRALPLKFIRKLAQLDLSKCPHEAFARDMFLFSLYTRGMSFIDMAYLKKSDLHNDMLSYRRRKTGQQLFIRWEPCMQTIVNRYKCSTSQYLLPIISSKSHDSRREYKNALFRVNRILKSVAYKIGLPSLSMYVARHSWASIAHSKNIPISVISEGMGHESETTTKIYLASLDSSLIDKANKAIIKSIGVE